MMGPPREPPLHPYCKSSVVPVLRSVRCVTATATKEKGGRREVIRCGRPAGFWTHGPEHTMASCPAHAALFSRTPGFTFTTMDGQPVEFYG